MSLVSSSMKLKAQAVQVIETSDGVVLKRGCTELKIAGAGAAEAVKKILAVAGNGGATREEILELFEPEAGPIIERLSEQLIGRRLLVPCEGEDLPEAPESSLDIFYWHFGEKTARVTERLNKRSFAILGVNCISRQLAASLAASEMKNFRTLDHPRLRNMRLFDDAGRFKADQWPASLQAPQSWTDRLAPESFDCLIATSDFGGQEEMHEWNTLCVRENRHFLPVVLQDLIGYVGPLVVPGETACFDCLRIRRNSQMNGYKPQRLIECVAFEGQRVTGFHPSMASIVGNLAAFELIKLYSEALPFLKVGTLIEVNLLTTELKTRRVLKIPRCPTCSPLKTRPSTTPYKPNFTQPAADDR
jgi:bacteriocin biosynthesis cyclodehydratase domain-containing protein